MQTHVAKRIQELVAQGNAMAASRDRERAWMEDVIMAQSWLTSAANAIHQVAPPGSFFRVEVDRLIAGSHQQNGILCKAFEKVLGVLQSLQLEAEAGLLTKLEYQVVATTFDEFIDHAASYHRSGKLQESSVIASAVLEDTIKRIASKNGIASNGMSLDPLIDELAKQNVFSPVKAKRLKAHAAVRNHALHAEWEKFDLKDAAKLIEGVRELLDEYL